MTVRERRVTEKSARDAIVGLVVNPASGRDVRRLVAQASVHPISEKCNIILRLFSGLRTAGVGRVVMMPDLAGLSERVCRAIGGNRCPDQWPNVFFVDMPVEGGPEDTPVAVQRMVASGVPVIVVIGGDGTHRLAATVCSDTPILALSSGTNNVFPQLRGG